MEFLNQLNDQIPGYVLVLSRVSAMIMTLPILSYSVLSRQIKGLLAIILTATIAPMVVTHAFYFQSPALLTVAIMRETFIGMSIGFGAKVLFEGFSMAGSFASRQMGLMMANVMDPTSQQQVPIVSQFWILILITFFLATNGHHLFISTIYTNFQLIPVGGGEFTPQLGRIISKTGSAAFVIAIKFAAPAMSLLLVTDAAIALMARVMPQMNIFIVSLPLKLMVGFYALIASLNVFQVLFNSVYNEMSQYLDAVIFQIGG